jgi:hypothetical protein
MTPSCYSQWDLAVAGVDAPTTRHHPPEHVLFMSILALTFQNVAISPPPPPAMTKILATDLTVA